MVAASLEHRRDNSITWRIIGGPGGGMRCRGHTNVERRLARYRNRRISGRVLRTQRRHHSHLQLLHQPDHKPEKQPDDSPQYNGHDSQEY